MSGTSEKRLFYGWYIVAISLLCRFMSTGVGFYIFNAFMDPLCKTRGWSRLDINFAPMLGNAVGVINIFVFGTLVMRVGPRWLMTIGPVISGLAFAGLGLAEQLWQFYGFFLLMILGNGAMAGVVSDTVVNNWFEKDRGKALGLSTVGVSLSGAVLPFTAMVIIERASLLSAFIWIGAAIVSLAPAAWFVVRDRAEILQVAPGRNSNFARRRTAGGGPGLSYNRRDARKTCENDGGRTRRRALDFYSSYTIGELLEIGMRLRAGDDGGDRRNVPTRAAFSRSGLFQA